MKLNSKFRTVLITGGTGSFGNEILKNFLKVDTIKEVRIFSRDELKQDNMRKKYNNKKLNFIIGDVRNKNSIENVCKNVDLIFHAAALKQVPSCEFFPDEAVKTNFVGSKNVIETAIKNEVKKIILLSTDKAVEPINAMGMSKALMEKLAISYSKNILNSKTIINCVRYGNVIASRGSIVPLMIDRVRSNKNILITNKDMTRFLLTLTEAIELVILAANQGKPGEIFIKKAPSANILDIANCVFEIFKKKPIIKYIGVRHGEKIHETLVSESEMLRASQSKKHFKISMDDRKLNYENFFSSGNLIKKLKKSYQSDNQILLSKKEIKKILLKLI